MTKKKSKVKDKKKKNKNKRKIMLKESVRRALDLHNDHSSNLEKLIGDE